MTVPAVCPVCGGIGRRLQTCALRLSAVRPRATRGDGAPRLSPAAAQVESEDLVFTLETIVEKFGEEMAPYAVGVCQHLTEAFWRACVRPGAPPAPAAAPAPARPALWPADGPGLP